MGSMLAVPVSSTRNRANEVIWQIAETEQRKGEQHRWTQIENKEENLEEKKDMSTTLHKRRIGAAAPIRLLRLLNRSILSLHYSLSHEYIVKELQSRIPGFAWV